MGFVSDALRTLIKKVADNLLDMCVVVGVQRVLRPIFPSFYSFFWLCTDHINDLVCGQLTSTLNTPIFSRWNSGVNGRTPSIHDCDSQIRRIKNGKLDVQRPIG